MILFIFLLSAAWFLSLLDAHAVMLIYLRNQVQYNSVDHDYAEYSIRPKKVILVSSKVFLNLTKFK